MTDLEEMGPIDYLVVEFGGSPLTGEAFSRLVDLVQRGLIRVLDLVFVTKQPDGSVTTLKPSEVSGAADAMFQGGWRGADVTVFDGASSGLLDQDDIDEAGKVLGPGSLAGFLVYENRWAAPLAIALRRSGGQLVASGRIPVQAILAALDATESDAAQLRPEPDSPAWKGLAMPGLLRGVARTAVVARTATAVSNRVSRRQYGRWARQEEEAYQQQQASTPPAQPAAAPVPPTDDMTRKLEQLNQLGQLKTQGILTEEELQAQKNRILAS